MKKLLLLSLFLPTLAFGQTNPPANAITFTVSPNANGVTRFEQSFDTGTTWAPTIPPLPSPVSGVYTTSFPATLTIGSVFTVQLRACNLAGCAPASVPVGFTYAGAKPTTVINNVTPILQ